MSHPDPNFTELSRLLRAKRYEQPPPGYFHSFSDKVIARIQAEEGGEHASWWSWFADRFDARPVLVCAYGLAVSALLFSGFRLSQAFEAELGPGPAPSAPWLAASPSSPLLLRAGYDQTVYSRRATTSSASGGLRFAVGDPVSPASALHLPVSWNAEPR